MLLRLLVALAALAVLMVAARDVVFTDGPRQDPRPRFDVDAAVRRTLAAKSARIDATYRPARGPTVSIVGRASFVGPETEVSAAVGDEPPAAVRVTATGAWLRPPGAASWTPISPEAVAGTAAEGGWGDLLRTLDASSDVGTDAAGRIVRFRLPLDDRGGRLDVRLSDFGTDVAVAVPP